MKNLLISLALGAAVVSTGAYAQQQGGGRGFGHDQTRDEAKQRADRLFQLLDANHDGVVTKAEAQQALAQFEAMRGDGGNGGHGAGRMQRMIDQAFNNAPSITQAQMEAQALARFDAMDTNHDGTVTAAEQQAARAAMAAARGAAAPATAPVATPQK